MKNPLRIYTFLQREEEINCTWICKEKYGVDIGFHIRFAKAIGCSKERSLESRIPRMMQLILCVEQKSIVMSHQMIVQRQVPFQKTGFDGRTSLFGSDNIFLIWIVTNTNYQFIEQPRARRAISR